MAGRLDSMGEIGSRVAATVVVALAASCSLIVDVGDLSRPDADVADGRDGDVAADSDADVELPDDAGPDGDVDAADADVSDADADTDADGDADDGGNGDGDTDADVSDGDADVDASDGDATTVGPPAHVWGEMTASGAPAGTDGCVATGSDLCMRSDTVDPGSLELSGGDIRLRGIVVGGGRP